MPLNAFIWPRVKIYSTEMLSCEFGAILGLKIDARWFLLVCGFRVPYMWMANVDNSERDRFWGIGRKEGVMKGVVGILCRNNMILWGGFF
jgi:hypothetical protein